MVDYNKRLVEVDEVLSYLSLKDLLKIPEDIRQLIKDNKDTEYTWKYDTSKELKDQNLNRDTIVILSYLNTEYLLNDEQKKLMKQIYEYNEKRLEEEKNKKYNPDDLFKNKHTIQEENVNTEQQALVVYKENVFMKIFRKIKSFFGWKS